MVSFWVYYSWWQYHYCRYGLLKIQIIVFYLSKTQLTIRLKFLLAHLAFWECIVNLLTLRSKEIIKWTDALKIVLHWDVCRWFSLPWLFSVMFWLSRDWLVNMPCPYWKKNLFGELMPQLESLTWTPRWVARRRFSFVVDPGNVQQTGECYSTTGLN